MIRASFMTARAACYAIALALVAVVAAAPAAHARSDLDTKKTITIVAGVLEWKDASLASFPKTHRKDKELDDTFAALGIPDKQRTLLLDDQATTANVLKAVERAVAEGGKNTTLIFYFAGHGLKADGEIVFATSDVSTKRSKETGLRLLDLQKALRGFRGRVVLMADCCHSGGLVAVGEALAAAKVKVAVLTSAEASNTSTGNWTFTQTVIDALNGRPIDDRNDDGTITFGELAAEVHDAMKHREQQRSATWSQPAFEDFALASAEVDPERLERGSGDHERRDWVVVSDQGKRRVARILGVGPARAPAGVAGQLRVAYYDYSDESLAWVADDITAPLSFQTWPVGTSLTVLWKGQPFAAKVTAVDDGFMKITYPGWAASWDEWITAARVAEAPAIAVPVTPARPAVGSGVSVEWQGKWFDAVVLSWQRDLTCIRYVGYSDEWNECVVADRVRAR